MLALYFLLDKRVIRLRSLFRSLIAGFLLALGYIMRPDALIVMASLAVYFFVLLLRAENMRQKLEKAMQFLAVSLTFLALTRLASYAIREQHQWTGS